MIFPFLKVGSLFIIWLQTTRLVESVLTIVWEKRASHLHRLGRTPLKNPGTTKCLRSSNYLLIVLIILILALNIVCTLSFIIDLAEKEIILIDHSVIHLPLTLFLQIRMLTRNINFSNKQVSFIIVQKYQFSDSKYREEGI